jgi:putative hydrolase of the HAD superfamily
VVVEAVIFDWGGTLTPWHAVDHEELWRAVCASHLAPGESIATAAAILAAEQELWLLAGREQRSATMSQIFERAGLTPTAEFLASYSRAWEPHTFTDPDAAGVLRTLRARGIKVGVLSNTMSPSTAVKSTGRSRTRRRSVRRCVRSG